MPTISMFFGIVIRMFYPPKEHDPPHIHAIYQGSEAVFSISDGEKQALFRRVRPDWFKLGSKYTEGELLADWVLCQHHEKPFPIEPLR